MGIALAVAIAPVTVAALPPVATAANQAALEEYVLTAPTGSGQTLPSAAPATSEPSASPEARPGVLSAGRPGQGPTAAAIGALGMLPVAIFATAAVLAACLLAVLLTNRREGGPTG